MQIENYNKPFLDALVRYDDGRDLSDYDFNQDGFGPPSDDDNKRKLAYRHRDIAEKYEKVFNNIILSAIHLVFLIQKTKNNKVEINSIFIRCLSLGPILLADSI